MGLKARLSSNCTKRANNGVNLVTSRKVNTRLARPMLLTTSRPALIKLFDSENELKCKNCFMILQELCLFSNFSGKFSETLYNDSI